MADLWKDGALHLYGPVGGAIFEESGFTDADVTSALAGRTGPLTVRLNSPGGSAFMGIAIYNALRAHDGAVTIYNDALAASAASVIYMAGDRRVMRPGALVMIHDPSGLTFGNSREHRKGADTLDTLAAAAAGIYAARSGLPAARVSALMTEETWLRGAEAQELGFADEVEPATTATMAFPQFDYSLFRHTPDAITKGRTTMSQALATQPAGPVPAKDAYQDIFTRCRSAKLSMEQTEMVMNQAAGDPIKARDLIINMVADTDTPEIRSQVPADFRPNGQGVADISDALFAKVSGKAPSAAAAPLMGLSMIELGELAQERLTGRPNRLGPSRGARVDALMAGGMHTTSDFPKLIGGTLNRVVQDRYTESLSPLLRLFTVRNAPDLRDLEVYRGGEFPQLLDVKEGAEVKYGSMSEELEKFSMSTGARLLAVSRNLLINDNYGALTDLSRAAGQAASGYVNRKVSAVFAANGGLGPLMSDAKTMFHADHGNVLTGTGSTLNVDGLSAARSKMRQQRGQDGTYITLTPKYLVVSPDLETQAETIVTALQANTLEGVNPFAGKFEVLVNERATGSRWYLFADPQQAACFAIAYLDGVTAPQVEVREGWTVLGQEYRVVFDVGCGATGWRGGVSAAGA